MFIDILSRQETSQLDRMAQTSADHLLYVLSRHTWLVLSINMSMHIQDTYLCQRTENRARKTNVLENVQVRYLLLVLYEPLPITVLTSLTTNGVGWGGLLTSFLLTTSKYVASFSNHMHAVRRGGVGWGKTTCSYVDIFFSNCNYVVGSCNTTCNYVVDSCNTTCNYVVIFSIFSQKNAIFRPRKNHPMKMSCYCCKTRKHPNCGIHFFGCFSWKKFAFRHNAILI